MPDIIAFLKHDDRCVRSAGAQALSVLSKYVEFQSSFQKPMSDIIALLKHENMNVRRTGAQVLSELTKQGYLPDMIVKLFTSVLALLYSHDHDSHNQGAFIINVLTEYAFILPILHEIWSVYAFIQDYSLSIPLEQNNFITEQMELHGFFKSL
ncbi:hypothetical protein M422DRAFT_773768 [Sphaerobolus stellatus SS14]|nr:hypothetical protein M422DRAFT_773768 [Sphaerobolus stellatus SS14]